MFERTIYLEEKSYLIGKKECEYYAYVEGDDIGFVILNYENYSELYEFNNGPYVYIGIYDSMEEAIQASKSMCYGE